MNHKILFVVLIILIAFVISIDAQNKTKKIKAVQIDDQVWMLKNLDVDHYRNGDPIPEVKDAEEWSKLTTGAWCYYNNDPINGVRYGKLYNWYAVNDPRGLAPEGWHIPSDLEWEELSEFLGGERVSGGKLKETGSSHWLNPNEATNESGFSALPGGGRDYDGTFFSIGSYSGWWSSSEFETTSAWVRFLTYDGTSMYRYVNYKGSGFSVRCIKDN